MSDKKIIDWLMEGDVSLEYQARRDLLACDDAGARRLRGRIAAEGWGKRFLDAQGADGHWGRGYYQPKWTSTHYTLLDLRNLEMPAEAEAPRAIIARLLGEATGPDGGVYYSPLLIKERRPSDVGINGMVLNFASHFRVGGRRLGEIADLLMRVQRGDGSWICEGSSAASQAAPHATICVLEGLSGYASMDPSPSSPDLGAAIDSGAEFLLRHRLFCPFGTSEPIDGKMLMLSYPCRWKYDILRALDWFQAARRPYDARMRPALEILLKKRRDDGCWPLQNRHPGQVHFDMEEAGKPSRWNSLRALRVVKAYVDKL